MSRKNVSELEQDLKRLKERQEKLKEELMQQKKAAEIRSKKERTRKLCSFAEIVTNKTGEEILNYPDPFELFILDHLDELKNLYNSYIQT